MGVNAAESTTGELLIRGLAPSGSKDVAQIQPKIPDSSVSAGDPVGRHVCFVGSPDFPAPGSAGGGEGVSTQHLGGHPGLHLASPAAGVRGALRPLPQPPFQLRGGVLAPRLFFHRGLQGRAGR